MKPAGKPVNTLNRRQWMALGLTFFLGIGLTLAGFWLARELELDRCAAAFRSRATEYYERLQTKLADATRAVQAVKGLYDSSEDVSLQEFQIFSRQILQYV